MVSVSTGERAVVAEKTGDDLDLLPRAIHVFDDTLDDRQSRDRTAFRWWQAARKRLGNWLEEEEAFGHFFLWIPVWLGTGAVLWFSAASDPSVAALTFAAILLAAGYWLAGPWRIALRGLVTILLLVTAGALLAAIETWRQDTVMLDSPITTTVTGTVVSREADSAGRWRYEIRLSDTVNPKLQRPPQVVRLTASRGAVAALGDRINGRARLSPPSGPALSTLNDFAFSAYFSGTGAVGFFYGGLEVLPPDAAAAPPSFQFSQMLAGLRGAISDRIRSVLPGDTGAFASSMVTDDRRAISDETTEALRLAGLAHVVAISGLNMALAAGIMFVGLRLVLSMSQELVHRLPTKKIAAAGALVTVSGYYMISGFAVSAERAYIMMAIMLMAALFGRPSISLRNVALSAIAILMLSPSAIMSPGFQMSFAATLALVSGYGAWQKRPQGDPVIAGLMSGFLFRPAWQFMRGVFLTSLIGGLSTALYSAEHFHRLAAWGLPANLLAMPIISFVVMPAGLLALALMPLGLDWLPLQVMGYGLDLVIAIAKWTASLGGDVLVGRMPLWFFIGMTVSLIVLAIMRSRLRFAGAALACVLCVALVLVPARSPPHLVIYEDGSMVGLVTGDVIATTRSRPPDFIFEQWRTALELTRHDKPLFKEGQAERQRERRTAAEMKEIRKSLEGDLATATAGRFTCRKNLWCVATVAKDASVVVVDEARLVGTACDLADLVVTPARLKWHECRSGATLLDARSLRRTGSLEISVESRSGDTPTFSVTPSFTSLARPWQRHRLYDWRSNSFLE